MSIGFSTVLEGGNKLQAALDQLETKTGNKIVRVALRDSQKILLKSSKASATSNVGGDMGKKIAKALQVRVGKRRMRGSYLFNVSLKDNPDFVHTLKTAVRKGGKKVVSYYIPAAIEFGHTSNGRFVQPISFLRAPDVATRQTRIDHFQNMVRKGIENLARAR